MAREYHGEGKRGQQSKEYLCWIAMKKRCLYEKHPHFEHYSKLGVSKKWVASYKAFLGDVGRAPSKDHTLDRIDTSKGYFPKNVRWATPVEQARNRKDSITLVVDGQELTASEAAEKFGLKYTTVRERLRRGYSGEDAIAPVGRFGRWRPAR